MIYLAQPYSHPNPKIMQARYELGMFYCYHFAARDPYSPIVHWHNVAQVHSLPTEAAYWLEHNYHMIDIARQLYVLQIPGWEDSIGLAAEIKHAMHKGKAVVTVTRDHEIHHIPPQALLDKMTHGKNYSKRSAVLLHLQNDDGGPG